MRQTMSSFVNRNFVPNSDFLNALVSNNNDLKFKELSSDQKALIDIQISNSGISNYLDNYEFEVGFNLVSSEDDSLHKAEVKIIKSRLDSATEMCRVDYEFKITKLE